MQVNVTPHAFDRMRERFNVHFETLRDFKAFLSEHCDLSKLQDGDRVHAGHMEFPVRRRKRKGHGVELVITTVLVRNA